MIDRVFWDIDETLIATTTWHDPFLKQQMFTLTDDPTSYYTVIRPVSNRLIEFSRDLVGKENVFILTTATKDYTEEINRIAKWEFDNSQIISRGMIKNQQSDNAFWSSCSVNPETIKSKNNVIIDNLPSYDNYEKMRLIGIERHKDRYLHIRDYYGSDSDEIDNGFAAECMDFLLSHFNEQ